MIHAAVKLLCFLGKGEPPQGLPDFYFSKEQTSLLGLWNLGELK